MVAGLHLDDYPVRSFHAYGRRLRLVAYYEIKREVVRDLRVRRRMTQDKLAKTAGVAKQTIVRIEGGPNTPQFDTIEKVAKALGVDADYITIYHTSDDEQFAGDEQQAKADQYKEAKYRQHSEEQVEGEPGV